MTISHTVSEVGHYGLGMAQLYRIDAPHFVAGFEVDQPLTKCCRSILILVRRELYHKHMVWRRHTVNFPTCPFGVRFWLTTAATLARFCS
jgi:hypothetical protein